MDLSDLNSLTIGIKGQQNVSFFFCRHCKRTHYEGSAKYKAHMLDHLKEAKVMPMAEYIRFVTEFN